MHRARLGIGWALLLAACEPVVSSRLRLAPAPTTADSATARIGAAPSEALAAVERLAVAYGLRPESGFPKECAREWRSGPSGPQRLRLYICASAPTQGGLEVRLSEYITSRWTLRGDSLRRALADTLARFGAVPSP
jgi:hypothetical protein